MADQWRTQVAEAVPARDGRPSRGPVFRSTSSKDGFPTLEGAATCWDIMVRSAEKYGDRSCLGHREIVDGKPGDYVWQTYRETLDLSKALGSALRHLGLQKGSRLGIYGANTPEWCMAMEACNSQSLQCVPLYDTLGAEAVEFIVKHGEVAAIVVQASKIPMLIGALPNCTSFVKSIISMGNWEEGARSKVKDLGIQTFSWEEIISLGRKNPAEPTPPLPADISTIMYTSGTTGEPKGVLLSHGAIIAQLAGLKQFLNINKTVLDENDVYLSYLPLAHIFERTADELNLYNGSSIGFWQGDVKALVDDIGALKPTYFNGVPRIYERIYAGVKAKVDSGSPIARFLFNVFYGRKVARLHGGAPQKGAAFLADLIVFNKVKTRLGGRVRFILSGAAPLAPHVEEFLNVALCAPAIQGYGLTETCAGGFISYPDHIEQAGTVGPPLPSLEVCLESVPEMTYDALAAEAPRGEVCIRGPVLFNGYYKREDLTKDAIDADGWFHTGDVGEWQTDGSMKIVDRKKNIFKLAQGEYVAVENLEIIYGNCSQLDQIWVYGNSFESSLVTVAVPNQAALEAWAKENSVGGNFTAICASPAAEKYLLGELVAVGKKKKLKGFELVRALHLEPQPFDMERDLITPTFKLKRPQLLKYYKAQIDAMYDKLRAAEAAKGPS